MARLRALERDRMCLCSLDTADRRAIERLIRRGLVVRVVRGIYARGDWWHALSVDQRHVCLARTLATMHPDWAFCGPTAAVLWGLHPPYDSLKTVHVAYGPGERHASGPTISWHQIPGLTTCVQDGALVTRLERTVMDCVRTLPVAEGLAIADEATRLAGWDDFHFLDYALEQRLTQAHGFRKAVLVAMLVDGRSESGGESVARANMILQGFALPELQLRVQGRAEGQKPFRCDFAWPLTGGRWVYGELDGRQKYEDPAMLKGRDTIGTLLAERRREAELSRSGQIVRFNYWEAANPAELSQILDRYDVPRVCAPVRLDASCRHAIKDVLAYLRQESDFSTDAERRLEQLRRRKLP